MKFVIVTNNPKVRDELGQEFDVDYADITYREILCKVRDMIYEGHKLLTHPLSGSVKPNETPYKSILVAKKTGKMDVQDASIIENSIITADKFSVKFPEMQRERRLSADRYHAHQERAHEHSGNFLAAYIKSLKKV